MPIFATAIMWGLAVLASFYGWGFVLGWIVGRRGHETRGADRLDAITWGMALCSFVGGVLNLFGVAGQNVLIVMVLVGIAACFVILFKSIRKPMAPPGLMMMTVFVVGLTLLRFAATVIVPAEGGSAGSTFNPHDDMHSYLVSIERLLQTGSLGIDPFNSRLMMSGLGGQHFLGALLLCVLPQDNVHMMDSGIGLVALALSSGGMALRLGLSRGLAGVFVLIPLALPMEIINISGAFTCAAVMLALASCLIDPSFLARARFAIVPALLLAAVCGFKSTMIPAAVIFIASFLLLYVVITRTRKSLLNGLLVPLLAMLFLLPWMVWQYRNSGTLLYPVLGLGDHVTRFFPDQLPVGPMPQGVVTAIFDNKIVPLVLALMLLLLVVVRKVPRHISGQAYITVLAFLLGWAAAAPLIGYATEFADLSRYMFPIYAAGMILASGFLCAMLMSITPRLAFVPVVCFLVATFPQWVRVWTVQIPRNLAAGISGSLRPVEQDVARFLELQQSIPAREPVLVYLTNPSVLDFTRNPIYVADWPGESSLPPGMPVFDGGQPLADYLLAHHIRYLAYSYAQQANFPRQVYGSDLDASAGRTIRRQAAESFAFQDDAQQLAKTHAVIFDNGLDYVIDLATRR